MGLRHRPGGGLKPPSKDSEKPFPPNALSCYALFYRSRRVSRWLSGWGMAGVVLLMTACLLALFSDHPVTGYTLVILPIALHEMALAVWRLVRGFGPASDPSSSAREESPREEPAITANSTSETRQHRFPPCTSVPATFRTSRGTMAVISGCAMTLKQGRPPRA